MASVFGVFRMIKDSGTIPLNDSLTLSLTRPNGTATGDIYQDVDLLANKPELGDHYLAGRASIYLSWSNASIFLTKVEKYSIELAAWETMYEDATGIATNDTTLIPVLLHNLPIKGSEMYRITLLDGTGSDQAGYALTRYELGLSEDRAAATPTL